MSAASPSARPWLMMFSRLALFASIQAALALAFALAGASDPWERSANWWPIVIAIANVICVVLLIRFFRAEGKRYWDMFRFERQHAKSDLVALLLLKVALAPVTHLPNVLLAR